MNRTEYLTARAAWKAAYADLTVRIREAKRARKAAQRDLAGKPYYSNWLRNVPQGWTDEQVKAANKLNDAAYKEMMSTWSVALKLKVEAGKLLEELVTLKQDAQRAYEAEKAVKEAA